MPDTQKTLQRLWSTQDLGALDAMVKMLGLDSACVSEITMHNSDPLVRSPHRLAESTAYALLLEAMAASSIWKYRSGTATALEIDCLDALHALHSTHFCGNQATRSLLVPNLCQPTVFMPAAMGAIS